MAVEVCPQSINKMTIDRYHASTSIENIRQRTQGLRSVEITMLRSKETQSGNQAQESIRAVNGSTPASLIHLICSFNFIA